MRISEKFNQSISLGLVFVMMHSGCATIVSGKTQDVMVRSNPPAAKVLIDGMMLGTTPMMANLIRKKRHTIEISKEGYASVTRATTRGFNWWYVGNLLFGGIIGLILDPITGAIYDVNPEEIYVDLESGQDVKGDIAKSETEKLEDEKKAS